MCLIPPDGYLEPGVKPWSLLILFPSPTFTPLLKTFRGYLYVIVFPSQLICLTVCNRTLALKGLHLPYFLININGAFWYRLLFVIKSSWLSFAVLNHK